MEYTKKEMKNDELWICILGFITVCIIVGISFILI